MSAFSPIILNFSLTTSTYCHTSPCLTLLLYPQSPPSCSFHTQTHTFTYSHTYAPSYNAYMYNHTYSHMYAPSLLAHTHLHSLTYMLSFSLAMHTFTHSHTYSLAQVCHLLPLLCTNPHSLIYLSLLLDCNIKQNIINKKNKGTNM